MCLFGYKIKTRHTKGLKQIRVDSKMFSTFLSEKIERPVNVGVDVDENFIPAFDNPQTSEYKEFVEDFKTKVSN